MKTETTNPENTSRPAAAGIAVKKVSLQMYVGQSDFTQEIKRMFDMAKSSGFELDLTFSHKQELAEDASFCPH